MAQSKRVPVRSLIAWALLALVLVVPLVIAAASPLQASRNVAYVVASLAGVAALCLLTLQPILARGHLPGPTSPRQRRWHQWTGAVLVVAVILHVGGLYITSPPDTLDALLLASPTPFSVYGVIAMWAIATTAVLAASRRRLGIAPKVWRAAHTALAVLVVVATLVHALQIEGTMGPWSKRVLCAAAVLSLGVVLWLRHRPSR